LTVTLGGSVATTDLANLVVAISGVGETLPVNPQTTNNITLPNGNFEIAANTSKIVDVYADVANTSGTTTANLQVIGNGSFSNVDLNQNADGQTMTINSGTLAAISLSATSQSSRFVLGNTTTNPSGVFTLNAVSAPVKIKKIGFLLNPSTSTAVTSITFNGKTENVNVVRATTTIDFSATPFEVNNTVGGTNFPVTVSYNKVGTTTNNGIVSNQAVQVKVVSIEYSSGNTSTTTYPTTGNATNAMTVVAGVPSLSFVSGANISSNLVAKLKVASDGAVRITRIPLKFVTTGNSSSIATGTQITVKNPAGITVATGTVAGTGTNGTSTVVFSSQYDVTGEVLSVYADGLVLSGTQDVNKVTTFLGAQTLFGWVDVEGDLTSITGSSLLDASRYDVNASTVVTD
jgi:hypothetical protein